ncbi:MAG TPA: tetratricopeptide repeat protein, partial [Myxococcota bacterium]
MAAINKRKLLESAQRHLQKGAVDKALADYQAVLQADPRDTNVRLKVGDLLQKAGRNDEAIAAYLKVADQFQRDGFDAKAVALYKQVTKIDPKRHDVYVPLADLYQRLGLVSEAMGALQVAAEAYQREGRKREALDLLRRMASLDPGNVTSRLKVAELLKQEGLVEEAVAEFREAAAELDRQGDWEARANVLERIIELRPEAIEELEALARLWLDHGQARRAHGVAQKLVAADPGRPDSLEILAHAYAGLGQEELAIDAFRQCAEAWRMRGEEDKAREIVQRHLPTQDFASLAAPVPEATSVAEPGASAELFGSSDELGAEPLAGEGMFGSEPIELDGSGVVELGADAREFENDMAVVRESARLRDDAAPPPPGDTGETSAPAAPPAAPSATAAPAPASDAGAEGDLEQLLAEAAVYARYGKHERAIACLEKALAQQPDHGGALEQLGEVHAAAGASEQAVAAWARAAELAAAAGDAARVVLLRERIEALDPDAAARLPVPPAGDTGPGNEAAASAPDAEQASDDEGLGEIEIDVDDAALEESDGAE